MYLLRSPDEHTPCTRKSVSKDQLRRLIELFQQLDEQLITLVLEKAEARSAMPNASAGREALPVPSVQFTTLNAMVSHLFREYMSHILSSMWFEEV